jgi:hypothetical protein
MNRHRLAPLALLVALAPAACTRQASIGNVGDKGTDAKAADPWPAAVGELRRQTDPGTCRRLLNQLNAELSANPSATSPQQLGDEDARQLAALLHLTEDERKELGGSAYTGLDAAYLAESLYLRDVVKSLDLQGLPPEKQAAAAFAWVCRQVYLRAWEITTPDGQPAYAPPLPPTAVLRRGFGTGLERAYAFLTLAQQVGLDGCLVGPPGREKAPSQSIAGGKLAKGPFWGVGVKAGDDVFLFDPWRGEPLPGPGGKGVGTLAQVKKSPDQLKPWRDDKANPWDVPPVDVADAAVYVAVPLSAVTPRIKLLESQLAAGLGVKLAADPREVKDRFAKGPAPASVWAPPPTTDPFAYPRALAYFLPKADGGLAPGDLRLSERLEQDQVPRSLMVSPPGLEHLEAALILAAQPRQAYHAALVAPGFREKIHRGQFNEVSRALVEHDRQFAAAEQRGREDASRAEDARSWVTKANAVYRKLSEARKPENRADLPAAEAEVAQFWRQELRGAMVLTDRALAETGRGEAGFLMAVCKHEQAERAQLRFDRAATAAAQGDRGKAAAEKARDQARTAAADAWAAAKDAWERYAPYADAQAAGYPGRADHAKRLAARATRLAANPASDL